MDPILKLYMYESWCQDLEEKNKFAESYTIMQGSFTNPEMARRMIKMENPDFESSDEDFERISNQMLEEDRNAKKKVKRKRRRSVVQKSS